MKITLLIITIGLLASLAKAQSISPAGVYAAASSGSAGAVSVDWIIGGLFINGGASVPLPVDLYAFDGRATPEGASLSWQTGWEKNSQGFAVQKATDALTFETIGWVAGAGTTTQTTHYHFIDVQLVTTSYYRLRQLDVDGSVQFSRIISVVPTAESMDRLLVYPNPSPTGQMTVQLPAGTRWATLVDSNGRLLQTLQKSSPQQPLQLPGVGLYFLHVQTQQSVKAVRLIRF